MNLIITNSFTLTALAIILIICEKLVEKEDPVNRKLGLLKVRNPDHRALSQLK
jgi:hypothetical protein